VSEGYTPGWVSKVIGQTIIAAVVAFLYMEEGGHDAMWLVFIAEGGWAGYFAICNFKYTFFG
jgi:hypothetical protein